MGTTQRKALGGNAWEVVVEEVGSDLAMPMSPKTCQQRQHLLTPSRFQMSDPAREGRVWHSGTISDAEEHL